MNISFSFDARYFYPAMAAIASLLDCAAGKVAYHFYLIISDDVDAPLQETLTSFIREQSPRSQVTYLSPKGMFDAGYETRGISTAAYYRLMLHRWLPEVDRVIYSDVDVLFATDLTELQAIPLGNCAVAAVKDIAVNLQETRKQLAEQFPYFNEYFVAKGYADYRNSGFLVLNLERIRELGWDDDIVKYSRLALNYQDQDILNIFLSRDASLICHLPPKYIAMPKHLCMGHYDQALAEGIISPQEYDDVVHHPAIYHYPGPTKPWSHPAESYNAAWVRYVEHKPRLRQHFRALRWPRWRRTVHSPNRRVRYVLGIPYAQQLVQDGGRVVTRKKLFGLVRTVKTAAGVFSVYVLGIPLMQRRNEARGTRICLLGLPIWRTTHAPR